MHEGSRTFTAVPWSSMLFQRHVGDMVGEHSQEKALKPLNILWKILLNGGDEGIRTLETVSRLRP